MLTATIRDLRYDFPKIEAMLQSGQDIQITKHNKPLAVLSKHKANERKKPPVFDIEAHRARLKRTWGDRVFSAAEVEEMRAFETGEP